jgi:adenylate cyclase
MSGDPEQEYFADGVVEEIITGLSRLRWLFVTSRTSSFQFKGLTLDLREIARRLGVRYVLEGSVRKAGPRKPGGNLDRLERNPPAKQAARMASF